MNKWLLSIAVMIWATQVMAQHVPSYGAHAESCIVGADLAQEELADGTARLVMASGLVPVITGGEDQFEAKYGINYHEFGCMPPSPMSCLADYNVEIFKYLDEEFGSNWREEVRDDLPGFKSYIMPFKNIFNGMGNRF